MRNLRFAAPTILLAVFPVLFLYRYNLGEVAGWKTIALPLTLSVVIAILITVGLSVLIVEPVRRAVCGSAIILFIFFFGAFADLAESLSGDFGIWRAALVWTALCSALVIWILRSRRSFRILYRGILYFGTFLVGSELVYIGAAFALHSGEEPIDNLRSTDTVTNKEFPDIYHIVLDGYAGAQTLFEKFGDDNAEFLERLKTNGFTIVGRSRSNYPATFLSLASMLNLDYEPALKIQIPRDHRNPETLIRLIRANRVSRYLREKGYKVIHFKTEWPGTSDNVYATQIVNCFEGASGPGNLGSSFSQVWRQSTVLRAFDSYLHDSTVVDPSVDAFKCMFAKLEESRTTPGPKYVFAHFMLPHPPYVFDEDGNRRRHSASSESNWRPEVEYWSQLKYLNKRISGIVESILAEPGYDPIIVIHSDHGPAFSGNAYSPEMLQERFRNLMAIRLPHGNENLVYDRMTSVNVFRLILDKFIDGQFDLLPDKSYFTNTDVSFFDHREVTDEIHFDE
jgi:Sulfatase